MRADPSDLDGKGEGDDRLRQAAAPLPSPARQGGHGTMTMINPTAPLKSEAEARTAAQASAVGIIVGAIGTIAEGWYSANGGAEASQRMVEKMTGQVQTAEQVQQAIQVGLIMTGVLVVIQLVLAGVQWKKPNQVLPILFLILVVWGLGTLALTLAGSGQMEALGVEPRPTWLMTVGFVTLLVAALLHVVGIRGAGALNRFRRGEVVGV
jgi:ABC-type Fe3+-siderophore transport system permease subunit